MTELPSTEQKGPEYVFGNPLGPDITANLLAHRQKADGLKQESALVKWVVDLMELAREPRHTRLGVVEASIQNRSGVAEGLKAMVDEVVAYNKKSQVELYLESKILAGDYRWLRQFIMSRGTSVSIVVNSLKSNGLGESTQSILELAVSHGQLEIIGMIWELYGDEIPAYTAEIGAGLISQLGQSVPSLHFLSAIFPALFSVDNDSTSNQENNAIYNEELRLARLRSTNDIRPDDKLWIPCSLDSANATVVKKLKSLNDKWIQILGDDESKENIDEEDLRGEFNKLCKLTLEQYHDVWENDAQARALLSLMYSDWFRKHNAMNRVYGAVWRKVCSEYTPHEWNNVYLNELNFEVNQKITAQISKGLIKSHKDYLAQPITDIIDAYPDIYKAQLKMNELVYDSALATGGIPYVNGIKSLFRIAQKSAQLTFLQDIVDTKRKPRVGYDHNLKYNIWDLSRGSIIYYNMSALEHALQKIKLNADVGNYAIVNIDNSFRRVDVTVEDDIVPDMGGNTDTRRENAWQDVKIHLVFLDLDSGEFPYINELQLGLYDFLVARKSLGGHGIYAKYREMEEIIRATRENYTKADPGIPVAHGGCTKCAAQL